MEVETSDSRPGDACQIPGTDDLHGMTVDLQPNAPARVNKAGAASGLRIRTVLSLLGSVETP
jgi:hypothetical protein